MSRISTVVSSNADAKVATTLSQVKASLGMVPNLLATLAHAPVALDGYLSLSKTLSRGRLSARQREILALAVGQENECQYCLSAHTAMAKAAGVSEADALKARGGDGEDPLERELASFAKKIVRLRGHVATEDIENARKAGIDDGLMMELVATVALNTLTNYANELAGTEIDFDRLPCGSGETLMRMSRATQFMRQEEKDNEWTYQVSNKSRKHFNQIGRMDR